MNKLPVFVLAVMLMIAGSFNLSTAQEQSIPEAQKRAFEKLIRDYLVSNPSVMQEIITSWQAYQQQNQAAEQRQRLETMRTAVIANSQDVFNSKFDYSTGNLKGDVTMVEFFDYNCGFCKRSLPDILALLESDKNLRLVVKEFPILGPSSVYAARAAMASKKQGKYWEFHVALMRARGLGQAQVEAIAKSVGLNVVQLKKDMEAPEIAQAIEANIQLASKLGVNGTPAFVIADRPIPGAVGLDVLRTQIADVRSKGGCKIC